MDSVTEPAKVDKISDSSPAMSSNPPSKEDGLQPDAGKSPTDAQNLSFVLEGINKVRFEDRPVPKIKNPDDVLVQIKYTGICGSDVR
jgi:hypothetical protein